MQTRCRDISICSCALNVELGGEVRPGSYEAEDRNSRRFCIMRNPVVRGFQDKGDEDLKDPRPRVAHARVGRVQAARHPRPRADLDLVGVHSVGRGSATLRPRYSTRPNRLSPMYV